MIKVSIVFILYRVYVGFVALHWLNSNCTVDVCHNKSALKEKCVL